MRASGYYLLATIVCLVFNLAASAQYPTDGCFIRYQYDNAGNRVQRDWYCVGEAQSGGYKSLVPDTTAGTGELADVHLLLAPNPANDLIRVTLTNGSSDGALVIHDGNGREVMRRTMNADGLALDVSDLATGPYYMSFIRDQERIVTGFAIQR